MSAPIRFDWRGEILEFRADGSLYLPAYHTLIISDLHFEKAASQISAVPLPAYDTPDTLLRVEQAITATGAGRCIFLGDSFHNNEVAWRLPADPLSKLHDLAQKCDLHWVEGNHDPDLPRHIPGHHCQELLIGSLEFRHMPVDNHKADFEFIGHYHPKARVKLRARRLSGKCFVCNDHRLIMPAFGTFTGGLNILDPIVKAILPNPQHVFFCHQTKIYHLPFFSSKFDR